MRRFSMLMVLSLLAIAPVAMAEDEHETHEQWTAAGLAASGFICRPAGPLANVHCVRANTDLTGPTILVRTFSPDGEEFLGFERFVRADLFAGQPCLDHETGEYAYVPAAPLGPFAVPYYVCHLFEDIDE